MSTISRKNPHLLASSFVYNYKQFESYVKFCMNILKSHNWLKNNQFNESVGDYEYITKLFHNFGVNPIGLMYMYKQYLKDVVQKIPEEKMFKLVTNKYYLTANSIIEKAFGGFSNKELGSNLIGSQSKIGRLCHVVLTKDFSVDPTHEYTEEECLNLLSEGKIFILQTDTETIFVDNNELNKKIKNNKVVFIDRDLSGGFVFESNTGDVIDLFEAGNEVERQIWFLKNSLFINHFRKNYLNFNNSQDLEFCLNISKSFDETCAHLETILKETTKQLKKKHIKNANQFFNLIKQIEEDKENQIINFYKPSNAIEIPHPHDSLTDEDDNFC